MNTIGVGALFAFAGVALGAFGAHALEGKVKPEDLPIWETAVRYHMYHALALMAVGVMQQMSALTQSALLTLSAALFSAGIVVFSGSLYLLVMTDRRWLGAVTPLGGLLLLAGWLTLAWGVGRIR
ncbi:MAG: DUF423 domain-containing protein [Candidatus Marinimicrobia bacterium]|nr:DUF423 domain-containing protein [Candidatus Neomarinimicrobiota bacterium]